MSGKRLLLIGDMVSGMSDAVTPYVGQLMDPAAGGGAPQTAAMESASAPPSAGGCTMTVNGLPVAHAGCLSMATLPLPTARPLAFCAGITLNGKPLLVELGQFMATPTGSLVSTAVTQQSVRCSKPVTAPSGAESDGAAPAGAAGGGAAGAGAPARGDYAQPSAEHVMASRISTARLADILPPQYQHLVGDPVDVATGAVVTWQTDDESPRFGLEFERRYDSHRSDREGALGWGWSHSFEQTLWLEPGRVVLRAAGREIEFDTFDLLDQVTRAGDVLRDPTGLLTLTSHGRNAWELFDGKCTRYFLPMPGTSGKDKDRGLAMLSTIARAGQPLVELHYDERACLTSVRTDGQAVFSLRYDREGRLESINDRVMRYAYSAAGDLTEARDLEGHARLYEYTSHLLVRETNRRGGAFYYGYDGHGAGARCVRTWGDGGRLHRMISYESGTTLVTDSLGERTSYGLSPIGLVTSVSDPLGATTELQYDDHLRLTAIRHPDQTRSVDIYDDAGNVVKHRDHGGATWQMEYDHGGRIVAGVDAAGGRWEFSHDLDGRLCRVQDPEHHIFRMEYAQGRLSKIIDPLGRVLEVSLGPTDELLELRVPSQPDTSFEYDAAGRLTGASTESGDEARWYYDGAGQLVGAMRGGTLTQWRRDPEGSVTQRQSDQELEVYARDAFGRLLRRHGEGVDISYHYDAEDRCLQASCEDGPRVEFVRDATGSVSSYRVDGGEPTQLQRTDGALTALLTDERTVSMAWDGAGRLLSCTDDNGKRTYAYGDDGLLLAFSTTDHACTLKRNGLGIVVSQTVGEQVVASPDADYRGNRYGLDLPGGASIFYLWSSAGAVERIGLVGEVAFEIDLEVSPDGSRGVARHGDARAEYSTAVGEDGAPVVAPAGTALDALFRPLANADGEPLVWDESRLVQEGDAVHVLAPPSGEPLAVVRGESLVFAQSVGGSTRAGSDQLVATCGLAPEPLPPRLFGLTPASVLRTTFRRQIWDPKPRPLPGTLPWNPDQWAPAVTDPAVGSTRLDADALMRLLSPFPLQKLTT